MRLKLRLHLQRTPKLNYSYLKKTSDKNAGLLTNPYFVQGVF